jgi:antitoxin component of MazEF toxin-antitoxin module
MKMTFQTKMRYNAGSMITVIPSALVKLLDVEHGDKLNWEADITEKGVKVLVTPLKKEVKKE